VCEVCVKWHAPAGARAAQNLTPIGMVERSRGRAGDTRASVRAVDPCATLLNGSGRHEPFGAESSAAGSMTSPRPDQLPHLTSARSTPDYARLGSAPSSVVRGTDNLVGRGHVPDG